MVRFFIKGIWCYKHGIMYGMKSLQHENVYSFVWTMPTLNRLWEMTCMQPSQRSPHKYTWGIGKQLHFLFFIHGQQLSAILIFKMSCWYSSNKPTDNYHLNLQKKHQLSADGGPKQRNKDASLNGAALVWMYSQTPVVMLTVNSCSSSFTLYSRIHSSTFPLVVLLLSCQSPPLLLIQ